MHPLADLLTCLRFFSRLPLPPEPTGRARGLAEAVIMVPVAGAVIGIVPAVVLAAGTAIGLPPLVVAALSIAALVAMTGALHEDGLADCADGFGGGRTIARKLEIMRDSRIGTFGTCALILSLLCRTAAVSALATPFVGRGAAALLLTAILSRTTCLLPLLLLRPARHEGLGTSAGRPSATRYAAAVILAACLSLGALAPGFAIGALMLAIAGAFIAAGAVSLIGYRQIRGHTGDVCGAAQQAAEITVLALLCIR